MTPEQAFYFAYKRGGTEELREVCCGDPWYAYAYASDIDKVPRDDTRFAACKRPKYAYWYASNVDKGHTKETRRACYKDSYYYLCYLEHILNSNYQEEIKLLTKIRRINCSD